MRNIATKTIFKETFTILLFRNSSVNKFSFLSNRDSLNLFFNSFFSQLRVKISLLALFFVNSLNAQTLTVDTYTTSTTWVVPACVTSITVRAWGGGGGGGGASATDRNGGGGGGGAYCTRVETVTPGETLTITVGAGGVGVSANTGGAGGFSQVAHSVGPVVFCRAAGGAGGQRGANNTSAGAGGAGGAIASNIPAGTGFRGGNGGASDPNTALDQSGGGGGGAGSGSIGGDGAIITAGIAGSPGGGAGGVGIGTSISTGGNGSPGIVLGGGGGGSTVFSSGTRAGAAGARGQITITYSATGCEPAQSTFSYSPAGSYTWVVPACVNFVTVEAFGSGGGGGGNIGVVSGGQETCTGAGGGGGGGYAARTYAVVPGQSYTIVVGAGGTAGTAGANGGGGGVISTNAGNGGAGGNSTFSGPATVGPGTLTGIGGAGGLASQGRNTTGGTCLAVNGAGGAGSLGLNGSINYRGGNGAAGVILNFSTDRSAGAGGGAGPGGNGGDAPVANSAGVGVNPPGGIGNPPGGNGGNGRTYNTTGTFGGNGGNGIAIGGGGGGGLIHIGAFGSVTATGGTGAIGEVRLTYNPACPLPIELTSFTGSDETRHNELNWSTASEINNDYFTLERSANGSEWQKVTEIDGAGTSVSVLNYLYSDYDFSPNMINYYRLSQTDFDGTVKNSGEIVSIDNRFKSKVIVRITNILGQNVSNDQKGIVIYVYEDGSNEMIFVD